MRSRRDYGLVGDLVTGSLGAVVGGWLVRRLDIVTPNNVPGHIVVSILGAGVLFAAVRVLRQTLGASLLPASPEALVGELEEQIRRLTSVQRRVLSRVLGERMPVDPNLAFDQQLTFAERIADRVAVFGGSWSFIGIFLTGMLAWMAVNGDIDRPFDPYPYILLNLFLSMLASVQAPLILMSQNRQAEKDRLNAQHDYEVNLKSELEIMMLHEKVDHLRETQWQELLTIQKEQIELLTKLIGKYGSAT